MKKRRRQPRAPETTPPAVLDFSRWRWSAAPLLALLGLLAGAWTFDAKLSLSGDNTEFITLARSLVQGKGLSYISEPAARAATKYPFGFPLMLAPFEWLFAGEWVPMKWLVVVLFAAALPVFYVLARDHLGPLPALAATLLCATHPLLLDYAHQVMSEVPYLLFSLLSLFLLERGLQRRDIVKNYALLGGFASMMWAYYLRGVGLVLVGAVVVYLLAGRRYRLGLGMGGAAFLCALPWALRNRAVGGGGFYFRQLVQVNPYYPEQGTLDFAGLLGRFAAHISIYLRRDLPGVFWPGFEGADSIFHPLPLALIALGLYAAWLSLKRRRHLLLSLYAAFFLGAVFLWPWTGDRFLVPLVPVLIFFGVRVALDLLERLERPGLRGGGKALIAAVFVLALVAQAKAAGRLAQSGEEDYWPAWRNYYAAGQWLRENAPPDAVVACRKSYWMYIVSGRVCTVYPFKEPEAVIAALEAEGVDYVVVEQLGFSQTPRFLWPAIQKYPRRFELAWHRRGPDTLVLRFLPLQ